MLEVDTINRIFTLNDFNTGNVGYLQRNDEEFDDEEEDILGAKWLQTDHTFKIIDFLPSIKAEEKYIVPEIGNTFLEGNAVTRYDIKSIMYAAIFRKIDPAERIFKRMPQKKKDELKEKNVQEKLFFGSKVIESLEARFKGDLNAILQTSKHISDGLQDIDTYITGILQNYQTLKDFIITESQKLPKE